MKRRVVFIVLFIGVMILTFWWELGGRAYVGERSMAPFYLRDSFPNFLSVVLFSCASMALLAYQQNAKIFRLVASFTCGMILYEFVQLIMPERVFDFMDIIATIVGGMFSYIVLSLINIYVKY